MHALSARPFETAAATRPLHLAWRLVRSFAPESRATLPPELRGLPDRMLRDIGVDPRAFAAHHAGAVTPPDILHSPRALAEFLATTVR